MSGADLRSNNLQPADYNTSQVDFQAVNPQLTAPIKRHSLSEADENGDNCHGLQDQNGHGACIAGPKIKDAEAAALKNETSGVSFANVKHKTHAPDLRS